jgi:cytochrome c-type biogenesis protein
VSYVSGQTLERNGRGNTSRLSSLFLSACFVIGFSAIFVAFGATATAFSRLLLSYRYEAGLVGGAVVALFGVFMTGLVRLPWLERDMRFHGSIPGGRPFGAFLLGLAFGFGWTPCIGPVLGAILTVSALSSTAAAGIVLLTVYSIGLGVPFLVSAAFADGLMNRLKAMRRLGRVLQVGAGGVMIAMGIAMITGTMSAFSFWLLENVPLLARIG